MSIHYESGCNGCSECVHCGMSNRTYPVIECDICGHSIDEGEGLYSLSQFEHLCKDCLFELFLKGLALDKNTIEDELTDEEYSLWDEFKEDHEESYPKDRYDSCFDEDWRLDR